MPFDRASYLNNCNAISNCINNIRLLRKELHYVETYADAFNQECNSFNNNCCYDNVSCGCYANCGFPCEGYANGCAVGCGIPFGNYNKPNKKKINRNIKSDDGPCNPFCKPCYKPICYDPSDKFKKCQCKTCLKSLNKIYGCGCGCLY